ncbi:hypothetical protein HHI36_012430 [Cryptolaemus montrouzieri]|uniref:FYVE-type zinc finger domain-containing protein n=1 Tax=Cryptolaemus montrouzieri TaxID=559131 RepID=A0ABD2NF61_9CUCU
MLVHYYKYTNNQNLVAHNHEIRHLKAELQNLRRKGALRPSADWDNPGPDPDRSCGRCRIELGRVINRGAYCRACRLKVCKGCREYSFRTTDWVCTVCHKRMEIQAASGEWMEFMRRPSRRRDNRVYVPATDLIKRTIRRSWTISNPTPPWTAPRSTPEMRPYNSLPRGQDISNYPSLQHQAGELNVNPLNAAESFLHKHSPARRTLSEDVYTERNNPHSSQHNLDNTTCSTPDSSPSKSPRSPRINPLVLYAQKDKSYKTRKKSSRNDLLKSESLAEGTSVAPLESKGEEVTDEVRTTEKRVSFDNCTRDLEDMPPRSPKHINPNINRAISLTDSPIRTARCSSHFTANRSLQERAATVTGNASFVDDLTSTAVTRTSTSSPETSSSGGAREEREFTPIELCDIEHISGTVFRKMTVRRRRQDMRKMAAVDNGWRRNESDLLDILAPEGDDYKLVFISSDSSSKEEDVDDNDSSSTASSFPIDECDWDYFEPGTVARPVISWNSPFGSPRVYRRSLIESPLGSPLVYRKTARESDTGTDEDYIRLDTGSPASSDSLYALKRDTEEGTIDTPVDKSMDEVALQCKHKVEREVHSVPPCQSCGAPTQYIPIPVPVPIPVPIPALWTAQEAMKFYGFQQPGNDQTLARFRIFPRNLWPVLNNATLMWSMMGSAGESTATQFSEHGAESGASRRAVVPNVDYGTVTMNECENLEQSADSNNYNGDDKTNSSSLQQIPDDDDQISGYLESENRLDDSSSSSTETDDSEYNNRRKSCVTRVYNVNGRDGDRESDDALPSSNLSSCDEEDGRVSRSSLREDMTSSWSADTDSDDTGTDQKSKRFSKVFVVNKNGDSSSEQRSSSSDSDMSDNDTDTELDCTVILQNIKYINQDDNMESGDMNNEIENETKDNIGDDESIDVDVPNEIMVDDNSLKESTSSSPNLADVTAESSTSSDVEAMREDVKGDIPGSLSADNLVRDDQQAAVVGEWNGAGEEIRSAGSVNIVGEFDCELSKTSSSCCGLRSTPAPGVLVTLDQQNDVSVGRHAARYTSLVMITQDSSTLSSATPSPYQQVSVVTSDTTTFVPDNDVIVQHTNWQKENRAEVEDLVIANKTQIKVSSGRNYKKLVILRNICLFL